MATGRSDFPNQVNNVLGFPFIFRGALDVRARTIHQKMLIAAVHALAALARLPVPKEVLAAYNLTQLAFGRDYIIPKPLDRGCSQRCRRRGARRDRGGCGACTLPGALSGLSHPAVRWRMALVRQAWAPARLDCILFDQSHEMHHPS